MIDQIIIFRLNCNQNPVDAFVFSQVLGQNYHSSTQIDRFYQK